MNNSNKNLTRINFSQLTVTYRTKSGGQKNFVVNYSTAIEKKAAPGGLVTAWFRMKVPSDYKSFIKAGHNFNYSYR